MKRKITIGLLVFSMIFLLGGIYIITSIETATTKLDNLIKLHQVKLMREQLLVNIQKVQSNIKLKNTRYARNMDTVIANVKNMERSADNCFECHHTQVMMQRLNNMKNDINDYKISVSRVFTKRARTARMEAEEDRAFKTGELLLAKVNKMINMASMSLEEKTQRSLQEISRTKIILYMLVFLVPFFTAGLVYIFSRAFTVPVNTLLKATRTIKAGNLDYRAEALNDEFGEVAVSFNEMADSLRQYIYEIRESENRYRMLFENAGEAIFILETEGKSAGKIVSANQAAADMHGYTMSELSELNISDLDAPDAAKNMQGCIRNVLNGDRISMEINHRKKDGTIFPVEVRAGLLEYKDHKYILAFDRDITERKQVESALLRAEQMKIVGELAAALAHEIRNSLAGIKITVEVLNEELDMAEENRDFMLRAIREIRNIESLLNSLLNFARPPKPSLTYTDINDVLEKTASFSSKNPLSKKSKKVHITKHLDEDIPKTLADPMQLQQIFLNLFFNSFQAMPDGGYLDMKSLYDAAADTILIEVSDTGSGIDNKTGKNIFKPFFTTKSKGTGLGLAITKQLIEQHGGEISFSSVEGKGTAFYIRLPVKSDNRRKHEKERHAVSDR